MSEHEEHQIPSQDGWREWSRYVLKELETLQKNGDRQQGQINELTLELAIAKLKSGFWGAISGVATTLLILGAEYLKRR